MVAKRRTGDIRIGISGWAYKSWRGVFYPEKLPHKQELVFAAQSFRSIEINGTHYSLQRPASFAQWDEQTPDDFVFAIKGSRFITHMKRLHDIETPLANFFAQGLLRLGPKLGPILWQFPPSFRFDADRIERFFDLLPRDTVAAAQLAKQYDQRLSGRSWPETDSKRKLRYAMEIRHESFVDGTFIALLRRHNIALVCADTVEWPLLMDVTADFLYCRLHGSAKLYSSGYGPKAIAHWADRVAAWAHGKEAPDGELASARPARKRATRDVFVYFDNDMKVRAPFDAQHLVSQVASRLGTRTGTRR